MNSFKLFLQAENLAAFKLVGGKITSLISYPSYFDSKIISNIAGMITFKQYTTLVCDDRIYLCIPLSKTSRLILASCLHTKVISLDAKLDMDLIGRSKSMCMLAYQLYTGHSFPQLDFQLKELDISNSNGFSTPKEHGLNMLYQNETLILKAIISLDDTALSQSLKRVTRGKILGKLFAKNNFLRGQKDVIISFTAKLTTTVIEAGLPLKEAFKLQDFVMEHTEKYLSIQSFSTWINKTVKIFFSKLKEYCSVKGMDLASQCANYIQHQYTKKIKVTRIAQVLNCSNSTLLRQFKKKYGMSISTYIRKVKIDKSKLFLLRTNYSVTYIAKYLSFFDRSHFIQTFKRFEGCTPNDFRKKHEVKS
ncbi:AraC family transcriptional regulator [Lactiplantibacillus plantarum]|uniref:helix-turn-helix domain-containing protein n=1 Tax=Lactiplantibacillus plantarum TaxID=1590 RepID=UPI0021A2751E|nr:AraC family transcriptional regulator [Lactiplantibacillus plantarum]MCT3215994.1 AraC family transcriptional regulator [Lactiplantibacillus plantarum]MCT3270407.1 AraC family transcriptional regulator [Lactiplantibacillus plantarum]